MHEVSDQPRALKPVSVPGRLHLFEFNDQPWLPRVLRNAETAYLEVAYRLFPLARLWAEKILTVVQPGQPVHILDLCSGSCGPLASIVAFIEERGYVASATLCDLYPNKESAVSPRLSWIPEPVDATRVPAEYEGIRTMFSAFHHFRPDAAKAILADAVKHNRPICIFESGSGTAAGIAAILGVPLVVLALMPFAQPFRWANLLFTYLVPVLPLIILWDGIVSMLRVYSPEQMKQLAASVTANGYSWESGRIHARGVPGGLPYLIGRPASCEARDADGTAPTRG